MPDDIVVKVGLDADGYLRGVRDMQGRTDDLQRSLSRLASGVSSQVSQGMNALTRLDLVQITTQQSAERLARAERDRNTAIAEFGPVSEQAVAASKELEAAKVAEEKANLRARMSYVLITADMVTLAAKLPATINQLHATAAAARAAAAGMTTMQLATAALGASIAGIAVILGGMAAFKEYEDRTRRGATATEELRLAEERLATTRERANRAGLFGSVILQNMADGWNKAAGDSFLRMPSALDDISDAQERVNEAQEAVDLEKAIQDSQDKAKADAEAAKAANEFAQAQQRLVSATTSGFSSLGINLSSFSLGFQEQMLANAGVSQEFIASLRPIVDVEKMLQGASGETGKALREQAAITAHKDETTAEFHDRLIALGFAEEEIKKRIDETGRALLSQADATRIASQATAQRTAGSSMPGANFRTNYGGELFGLDAFLEANKNNIVAQLTGHAAGSYMGNINAGRFNGQAIADVLRGRTMGNEIGNVAGYFVSNEQQKAQLREILKRLITAAAPASQWDSLLNEARIPGFAHGFDGIVRGPSLFMAGEHGPERLSVRPVAGDHEGSSSNTTVVFQPGSIVVKGNQADELMRTLRRMGVGA